MSFSGKSVVITGAGQGIGRALAHAFAAEGARVCVSDRDADLCSKVAAEVGGHPAVCDVSSDVQIGAMIETAQAALGDIDIFVSNAGFAVGEPDHAASAEDSVWQASWDVHVMAHVRASRRLLPGMIARGSGHLVQVASAAGLLNQVGDAAYSATKHAAVSFSQSLAITHGDDGIDVSVVCPLYVATPLLGYVEGQLPDIPNPRVLSAGDVALSVLEGVRDKRFLILPHPEAADYARARMADTDLWIRKMRAVRRRALDQIGDGGWQDLHLHI